MGRATGYEKGKVLVRYSDTYNKEGINVNFAEWLGDKLSCAPGERVWKTRPYHAVPV